jgi:hypothetical protein
VRAANSINLRFGVVRRVWVDANAGMNGNRTASSDVFHTGSGEATTATSYCYDWGRPPHRSKGLHGWSFNAYRLLQHRRQGRRHLRQPQHRARISVNLRATRRLGHTNSTTQRSGRHSLGGLWVLLRNKSPGQLFDRSSSNPWRSILQYVAGPGSNYEKT